MLSAGRLIGYLPLYLLEMEEAVCLVADLLHSTLNSRRQGPWQLFCLLALWLVFNVKLFSLNLGQGPATIHVPTIPGFQSEIPGDLGKAAKMSEVRDVWSWETGLLGGLCCSSHTPTCTRRWVGALSSPDAQWEGLHDGPVRACHVPPGASGAGVSLHSRNPKEVGVKVRSTTCPPAGQRCTFSGEQVGPQCPSTGLGCLSSSQEGAWRQEKRLQTIWHPG